MVTNEYFYPKGEKCHKCDSTDIEAHVVNEVNGMAVGPYMVLTCQDCHYETYEEREIKDD